MSDALKRMVKEKVITPFLNARGIIDATVSWTQPCMLADEMLAIVNTHAQLNRATNHLVMALISKDPDERANELTLFRDCIRVLKGTHENSEEKNTHMRKP